MRRVSELSLVRRRMDSCSASLHAQLNFILTIRNILRFSVLVSEDAELSDESLDHAEVVRDLDVVVSLGGSL